MLSEMVRAPLPTVQTLLLLPAHPLPPEAVRADLQVNCPVCSGSHALLPEVVQAELQVDRPVCPTFLPVTLPLVQTLSLEAQGSPLLLETLLGVSLRLLDVAA